MKVRVNQLADVTHKTSARLRFPADDGSVQEDDFLILYRGMSPKMARELSEVTSEDDRIEMAKYLARAVKSMPEVIGDDEQPAPITVEFFDAMEFENLRACFKAVTEGYNGGPIQPASSATTSEPAS